MTALLIQPQKGGCSFQVQVVPRASRTQIMGVKEGAIRLRVAAPPVDGRANEACLEFFARLLGTAKSNIRILRGHQNKKKTLLVEGIGPDQLSQRLFETLEF